MVFKREKEESKLNLVCPVFMSNLKQAVIPLEKVAEAGIDVYLVTGGEPEVETGKIKIIGSRSTGLYSLTKKTVDLCQELKGKVILMNPAGSTKSVLASYLASKVTKNPYGVRLAGRTFEIKRLARSFFDSLRSFILKKIWKFFIKRSDFVIALTPALRDMAKEWEADKVFLIPQGVDTNLFKPTCEKRGNYLLFVGRLEPEKDFDTLLAGFELISRIYPNLKLKIVGTGSLEEELRQRTANNDRIEMLGEVDQKKLPPIYSQALALVLTSRSEGLPTVVLEAMACSTPVLVSDLSYTDQIVKKGETGYTFKVGDVECFERSFERLQEDYKAGIGLQESCRQLVEKDYSLKAITSRWQQVKDWLQ